ncbi:hypothetical protein GJ496_002494 [Pomphorhynchus laevis]|nr:hypothetical protein GJ496_002494 [Pomphorhynchus laevis]
MDVLCTAKCTSEQLPDHRGTKSKMAHVFWRVINILGIILSLACLLLQVFAVLVGSWKGQEITVSRFEPTLFNVYMTRGNGLFTSTIDVAFVDSDGINELLSVKVINRHPMVTGDALRHCVVGPTLTHQVIIVLSF